MRRCWDFLDQTSRSFAAVIKELDGDLARTVCPSVVRAFYEFHKCLLLDMSLLPRPTCLGHDRGRYDYTR
jgi:hypothetical protein